VTTKIEAIYENGKLLLPQPLPLPENSRIQRISRSIISSSVQFKRPTAFLQFS